MESAPLFPEQWPQKHAVSGEGRGRQSLLVGDSHPLVQGRLQPHSPSGCCSVPVPESLLPPDMASPGVLAKGDASLLSNFRQIRRSRV